MKVTILLGLAALSGVLTVLGFLPEGLLPFTAGPAVVLGCGWPVLRRASPAEPSLLKLTVVSALVSAPVAAALFAGLLCWRVPGSGGGPALTPHQALASTLGIVAALALLARLPGPKESIESSEPHRSGERGGLGAAAWAVLFSSLLLVGVVSWLVLARGAAARVLPSGAAWHAGVAGLIARGGPLENPWLAGEALPAHPGYGALVATIASAFGLSMTRAMAWLGVASLALLPIVMYLFAAPLWREKWRALLAPFAALLAWNAAHGLRWPPIVLPAETGGLLYGLAAFVRPGPVAPALALGAGAWMCAAHGLRHGQRPWVAACALLAGFAFALHPALGAATFAAVLFAAVLSPVPAGVRSKVVVACVLAAIPGSILAWHFGTSTAPVRPHGAAPSGADWMIAAAPLALLALGLRFGSGQRAARAGSSGAQDLESDSILTRLAICAVLAPAAIAWIGVADPLEAPALLRLASLPLGLLAAGGAVDLLAGPIPARVVGGLLVAATTLGAASVHRGAFEGLHALSRTAVPVSDADGFIAPSAGRDERNRDASNSGDIEARAAAYAWLRAQHELRARRPILVRSVALDSNRVGGSFTPHLAGLYADLPMWCDRRIEFSPGNTRWRDRHERLHQLYRDRERWEPRMIREFEDVGRPAIFLVEERDRLKTLRGATDLEFRGVDNRLLRMGCERIHVEGRVALYLWEPTAGVER